MATKQLPANVPSAKARKFFEAAEEAVAYLAERWADEGQYEDIREYAKVLEPIAKKCRVKIERMLTAPFGCEYTTDGRRYRLVNDGRHYLYRRIA